MVQSCVATDTWAANGGGQAEIRAVKPDLLVISQTSAVHEEIRDLLSAIVKVHDQGGPLPAAANKPAEAKHEEVVTRSYILQMNPTSEPSTQRNQIRELIVSALPDEAWTGRLTDGQAVVLEVFHDRIVVRQTPAVQEKLEKILSDSGIATAAQSNAPGMPGGVGVGGFGGPAGDSGLGFQPPTGPEGAAGFAPGGGFGFGIQPGPGAAPAPTPAAGE